MIEAVNARVQAVFHAGRFPLIPVGSRIAFTNPIVSATSSAVRHRTTASGRMLLNLAIAAFRAES